MQRGGDRTARHLPPARWYIWMRWQAGHRIVCRARPNRMKAPSMPAPMRSPARSSPTRGSSKTPARKPPNAMGRLKRMSRRDRRRRPAKSLTMSGSPVRLRGCFGLSLAGSRMSAYSRRIRRSPDSSTPVSWPRKLMPRRDCERPSFETEARTFRTVIEPMEISSSRTGAA